MNTISSTRWPDVLHAFRIRSHGRIQVRNTTRRFGFQIRARDTLPHPVLLFGLAQVDSLGPPARFAVRIEVESGEVWDAAHEGGLLATVDHANWPSQDEAHPLVLRWELERTGTALIPRLYVGQEEVLYPAQMLSGEAPFVAFSGHNLDRVEARMVWSPGYVWCQDQLR